MPKPLPPFNASREFVYVRPGAVNGNFYSPGDAVPKDAFRVRTLRQMYEQRKIDFSDDAPAQPAKAAVQVGACVPNLDGPGPRDVKAREPEPLRIPPDWRDWHWQVQAKFVASLGYPRPKNGADAIAILEAEEQRQNV